MPSGLPARAVQNVACSADMQSIVVKANKSPVTVQVDGMPERFAQNVYDLSSSVSTQPDTSTLSNLATPQNMAIAGGAVLAAVAAKWILDTPSRAYKDGENVVGDEYNDWTDEGVLEYYWGEHIHLGYYTKEEQAKDYKKKDFIEVLTALL